YLPGIARDAVPSFAAISREPGQSADKLHQFLLSPHGGMPRPPRLTPPQLDAVVAYIRSLAPP
ncbi:MAG: hypothetical protein JO157_17165, partial [Acetobacteraceae bacterium]|nr:hypothetical protein [Acetobacteraceae bacterium]